MAASSRIRRVRLADGQVVHVDWSSRLTSTPS